MCYLCIELTNKFNRAIQRAGVEGKTDLLSQLFEKRNWFLNSDEKDRHDIAQFFNGDDEIGDGHDVLNGVLWDEVLDIKFKALDKNLYPDHELNPTTEAVPVVESKIEPTCPHDWREYVGLGLHPPEIICCNCGKTKADST
jgi:hypothetical protein